jgi:anaerobic selenocysteine-containing dehydrogenase
MPSQTHYRACNLCEAMCGIAIEHDGQQVLGIRPDPDDPFSLGHICPKAAALADLHTDPDRLRRPLRRRGSTWEEIDWPTAFDEIGSRLLELRARHGRHSVALYLGNPTVHNYGASVYGAFVLPSFLHTKNRYSATSVDQLPRMLVSLLLYGNQVLLPIPDVDRTAYLLMLGANPAVSNGSIMTAPGIADRLKALRRRGGKLVVLDPRRTETASLADEHLFVRPGTDALFLLGLLHTVFAEGLTRPGRLEPHTDGLAEVRALAGRFPPERVAKRCGIPEDTIRRLAREFAAAPSAVCYGRVGVSVQEYGTLATWLCDVLNLVTGNLDRPGGSMFTTPAADVVKLAARGGQTGTFARYRSRVRDLPEFSGEFPVATLADEIETPGPGQVRALITLAGNPVLSTPNGSRLDRALAGLDLQISIDPYLNETTRHAHYILPPTSPLEHEHFDLIFHVLAVRNTVRFAPAVFAPPQGALHDWQILLELCARLAGTGPLGAIKRGLTRLVGRALTPERLVSLLVRLGPYGDRFNPFSKGLNLAKVKRAEHGLDLGPLEPRLPERLCTPDHRIRLAPPEILADLERLERALDQAPPHPDQLLLIGRRDLRTNNSWMHNSLRLARGRRRCTLRMHPEDAESRSLKDGQKVELRSRAGAIEVDLELSDELMRGVVSLPHGWGHGREGVRLQVASAHAGVSVNDVTDETLLDALSGNAGLNGVPVQVAAAG